MSQQYPPNKASSNEASKTGVTAVLDSLIRDMDERERKTEGPLVKRRSPSPLLSETEVLDLSAAEATTRSVAETASATAEAPTNPAPAPAPPSQTMPESAPLPPPASQIAFTERNRLGRPMWSMAAVTALRLPHRILEGLGGLRDEDDAQWLGAMVKLLAPMCRGLVDEPTMLVSSGSVDLASALGLSVQAPGSLPPYGGSIYCTVDNSAAGLEWVRRVRGDRQLHLILDGTDMDLIQIGEPTAVSYTTRRGAVAALEISEATGATIAFGLNSDGTPIRATALEVAMAVRSLIRTRR